MAEFVNADTLAEGLSGFDPTRSALEAGRIMLRRLRQLASQRADFAFEITLASRSFARWLEQLCRNGYSFHLIYLWLPTPEIAIARVAERARLGGHVLPDGIIRRRYHAGLKNFFRLYCPLATTWRFFDNSSAEPRLLAAGSLGRAEYVGDRFLWDRIVAEAAHE